MKTKSFAFTCIGYDLFGDYKNPPNHETKFTDYVDTTVNEWIKQQANIRIMDIRHHWPAIGSSAAGSGHYNALCFVTVLYDHEA